MPTAVSCESMTASVPSRIALATSATSARVGPRRGDHRVEHLRRGDRRARELAGLREQVLLDERHELDRQLDAEVAARDHDAVRGADDLVHAVDGLRLLDLRDERQARVLADELDVLRAAHERQRDEVDADLLARGEVLEVLLRDGRDLLERAGDVEALARRDRAAHLDLGVDLEARRPHRLDAQADGAVGEVHDVAGGHRGAELGARDVQPRRRAEPFVAADERHVVAGLELGDVALERADAHLRAGQVLEDRDGAAGAAGGLAHAAGGLGVLLGGAVREVQPRDVHPRVDHPHEGLGIPRGRADGGHDLRATRQGAPRYWPGAAPPRFERDEISR